MWRFWKMHKFSEIYIKDFRLLENFSFEPNQTKDDLTINILMGKNGSGKSTFIDALYDIAGSQDTYHDVFIATHSSILATDAKSSELYKFELKNEKIKVVDIPVKLYGSNVSDVANIRFQTNSL